MLMRFFYVSFLLLCSVVLFVVTSVFRLNNNIVPDDYPLSDWVNVLPVAHLAENPLFAAFYSGRSWLAVSDLRESTAVERDGVDDAVQKAVAVNLTDPGAAAKLAQALEADGNRVAYQQLTGLLVKQWPARSYQLAVAKLEQRENERLQRKVKQLENLMAAEEIRVIRELQRREVPAADKKKEIAQAKREIKQARQQHIKRLRAESARKREQILMAVRKKIFGSGSGIIDGTKNK